MFKKIFLSLTLAVCLLSPSLVSSQVALAVQDAPLIEQQGVNLLESFETGTGLKVKSDAKYKYDTRVPGASNIVNMTNSIIGLLKYAAFGLMLLFVAISITEMIAGGDEIKDIYDKNKSYAVSLIVAIVIILTAEFLFNEVFSFGAQELLSSPAAAKAAAAKASAEILGIARIFEMLAGAIAVLMFVMAGINLTVNAIDEGAVEKAKKQIGYGALGVLVIIFAETVVQGVLYADTKNIDAQAARELMVSLTNFTSGVVVTLSLLAFFYAGYLYVFRGIEDSAEKIKKTLTGAVAGILIAAAAFGIVNTVVSLDTTNTIEQRQ